MTEPIDNLQQRCAEIVEWQRTGVLLGNALRNYAEAHWAGRHDSLQMAERDTSAQAMQWIAKWDTPPAGEPVAWRQGSLTTVNQDPYPSLGDWFVQFWEGDDVAARVYGNDMETLRRRCAVIAAPQPTQAQAGAVPLTDEQSHALLNRMANEADQWADGLSYEPTPEQISGWCVSFIQREIQAAQGIKGGQHGADT